MSDKMSSNVRTAVRVSGLSKSFGGVRALEEVNLEISYGEIHALLGENGAGKSTLLKILSGVQDPDAGTVEIDGVPMREQMRAASHSTGIAMIFQEMSLIPTLTVAQNVFLNRELRNRFRLIDDRRAVEQTRSLFHKFNVEVDPTLLVSELSSGQRQLTEIVKALSHDARILILDEPTTALSGNEVECLFTLLRSLRAQGVAIVYVSHRMTEIMQIADRASILRSGRLVLTEPLSHLTLEAIVEHIVGRRGSLLNLPEEKVEFRAPALELRGVSGKSKPCLANLVVHHGEVVGIAGLLGSGRSSLARVLFGIDPMKTGEIRVNGVPISISNPRDAIAAGIAMVPEDRLRQGLVSQHSVGANLCLPMLDRISRFFWVSKKAAARLVGEQRTSLRIKTESADLSVLALSGGNQQKVVLGKWLAANPDILVLDEPTSGVDIGSKREIIDAIRKLAGEGKGVLLISSELSELLAASDKIIVMVAGRTVRTIRRDDLRGRDSMGQLTSSSLGYAEQQLQVAIQNANANN